MDSEVCNGELGQPILSFNKKGRDIPKKEQQSSVSLTHLVCSAIVILVSDEWAAHRSVLSCEESLNLKEIFQRDGELVANNEQGGPRERTLY